MLPELMIGLFMPSVMAKMPEAWSPLVIAEMSPSFSMAIGL